MNALVEIVQCYTKDSWFYKGQMVQSSLPRCCSLNAFFPFLIFTPFLLNERMVSTLVECADKSVRRRLVCDRYVPPFLLS